MWRALRATPRRTLEIDSAARISPFAEGLFLLQFAAPAAPAWQQLLADSGIEIVERLPERAVLVVATAREAETLGPLPWVEFVGPYLPAYKFSARPGAGTFFHIQMADTPRTAAAIARIAARVGGFIALTRYDNQLLAQVRTDAATAAALLDEPFVLGVEAMLPMEASDERQALALTGPITTPGAANTTYLDWLAAAPRFITPNALTNSGIVIDIADSGVDQGCNMADEHPDLKGRGVYFKDPASPYRYDYSGHGTVVATVAGGNPVAGVTYTATGVATTGLGFKDSDSYGQFYYGLGVAPGIRIGSTRILTSNYTPGVTVAQWTTSAATSMCNTATDVCLDSTSSCAATVQNISSNEYDDTGSAAGVYTTRARELDISVRNADRATMKPLAITVSAGNYGQRKTVDQYGQVTYEPSTEVMSPATAKNTISIGAVESARDSIVACNSDGTGGNNPALRGLAQGYGTVAYASRRGTKDTRLKPDLLAPATLAFGAHTQRPGAGTWCGQASFASAFPSPQYHGTSGTSFAAPVGAGAVALLRYHYATNYGFVPSPAMYKAMLVAGARSVTGGVDRLQTYLQGTTSTVAGWPSKAQGFGVITLNDLLTTTAVQKAWHDQATVLTMGQTFQRTITVTDPSKPLRIVMAYTDKEAAVGDPANPSVPVMVNDLMLTAEFNQFPYRLSGNYTDANGWSKTHTLCTASQPSGCVPVNDVRNNVEVLNINPSRFTNTANRTFTLLVTAQNLNGIAVAGQSGGANNQDFALFVLNGTMQ
ncbi:MAG: S8 family serine peptidase [Acidobacteriota bacterium]|nr:S8 family serine peptidase [Acidobacteriota bacterium]